MTIEVLVVDDHAIIRDGLKKILADSCDAVVAGEAANGNAALEKARERQWDVVVLDMSMPGPGRSGLELLKMLKAERPRMPVLVFSMHQEEQFAVRAIRAGAAGYLSKDSDIDLLLPAIRRVAAGGAFVSDRVAQLLVSESPRRTDAPCHTLLSDREWAVFTRIVQGASLTKIAEELCVSIKTVSSHKSHILAKMNLSGQAEMVRYAIEHRLLDPTPE